jgi:hypothetical protein
MRRHPALKWCVPQLFAAAAAASSFLSQPPGRPLRTQARKGLCGAEAVLASGVCARTCGRCVVGPLPAAAAPGGGREADLLAACSPERHLLAALEESREITLFAALLRATGVAAHLNASHVDVTLIAPLDGPLGRHLSATGINATGLSDATRGAAREMLLRHILPGAKAPPALFARGEHATAAGGSRLFTLGGRAVTGGGDGGAELMSYAHLCVSAVYTIDAVLLPGPPPPKAAPAVPSAFLAAAAAAEAGDAPEAEAATRGCVEVAELSSAGAAAALRLSGAAAAPSPRCRRP